MASQFPMIIKPLKLSGGLTVVLTSPVPSKRSAYRLYPRDQELSLPYANIMLELENSPSEDHCANKSDAVSYDDPIKMVSTSRFVAMGLEETYGKHRGII